MPLHVKIIIGLLLGVIWALISSNFGLSTFTINWIAPFGDIFINLLKLIAVPLVLFSIIKGITGLSDIKTLGKMGVKTLTIYLSTTVLAVTLGVLLVNVIQPGKLIGEDQRITNRIGYELWVNQNTAVERIDSENYLNNPQYADKVAIARQILNQQEENSTVESKISTAKQTKNSGPLQFLVDMVPSNIFLSLNNNGLMLQVIVFAILFGITCILLEPTTVAPVVKLVDGLNEVFLKMVDIVMLGAPFFVFCLLAGKMSQLAGDDPNGVIEVFKGLGWYSLTVVIGLGIMAFVVYPLIMIALTKKIEYFSFFKNIGPAQMLAFSTSSSAATLPVTMECVERNLNVPKRITSFVLPIGATVNMDGTSLYQAVAVVFLAQFHMIDLDLSQQLTIIFTATLASIGSAAVPSAGLIMLIIVLESVGLNPAWIAIIFPVDRILDMCRTVVNVTGDCVVASIIAKTETIEEPAV